jgi:hypothetical protein
MSAGTPVAERREQPGAGNHGAVRRTTGDE